MRIATFVAMLSVGCSRCEHRPAPEPPAPTTRTESEPNDNAATATVVGAIGRVRGHLAARDVDVFAFNPQPNQVVDVTVTSLDGGIIMVEVTDTAQLTLAKAQAGTEPATFTALGGAPSVYVALRAADGRKQLDYDIWANYHERPPSLEQEPNDIPVRATPLQIGTPLSGFLAYRDDIDNFSVALPNAALVDGGDAPPDGPLPVGDIVPTTPRPTSLRFDVSGVEFVALSLEVRDDAGVVLFRGTSDVGGAVSLRNVSAKGLGDSALLRVSSAAVPHGGPPGANSTAFYTVSAEWEAANPTAEEEPNDDIAHATPVSLNGFRDGYVSPAGDVDVYRADASTPQVVTFRAAGIMGVDFQLALLALDGGVTRQANDGSVGEGEALTGVPCSPSCFVRVEVAPRRAGRSTSLQAYRLTCDATADDGSVERESPTPMSIRPGTTVRGNLYPRGDRDEFFIDLRESEVKTPLYATVSQVPKVEQALSLFRRLPDGTKQLVQSSERSRGSNRLTSIRFSAAPGEYLLVLTAVRGENSHDSYQLTLSETE